MVHFSKRLLQIGAAALVLLGDAGYGLWQLSRAPCFQLAGPIVCRVDTDERIVALTFDDGPTRMGVDFLLPLLAVKFKIDPSVVSGPAMTTLVDATGLFIYFSIAGIILGL